jgi:ABC-type branched-subunit amino acid transport system substrate-binding protein
MSQGIAKTHGLKTLEPQIHPWESSEYYPQWTNIIAQKPDMVDNGQKMPENTAGCVRQGRELGFKGPMFCLTSGDPNQTVQMVGKDFATNFVFWSYNPYGKESPPMVKDEVLPRWEKVHSEPMASDMAYGWDLIYTLAQAMEKAQSIDPTEVVKAWENMDTIQTVRGTSRMGGLKTFGINHLVFSPIGVMRLQDGGLDFIKWIDPYMP